MNNPYQAPNTNITDVQTETYQPKIFTTKGRIGRLRYLAYSMASILILIPFVVFAGLAAALNNNTGLENPIMLVTIGVGYIFVIVYMVILMKRRFNDMGKSGWFCLLMLVPIVSAIVAIWLMFGKGDVSSNQFGPAPHKNSIAVKFFGLVLPILLLIIMAATAIPAYNDYIERSQAYDGL